LEGGRPRNLRAIAIIESDENFNSPKFETLRTSDQVESCKVTHYSAQRVEIEAQLTAPGCLIFNDAYYPGWRSRRITEDREFELTTYRADRVMRAVMLPAGKHRVIYSYNPPRVYLGGVVSGCAWLLLFSGAICWGRRRAR
jgi:uncharacterized membrane protein YfhO